MAYFKPPLLPKLKLPEKGPPEQSRAEPVPHVVPHSTTHIAAKPPKVWRVTEPELNDLCQWLVPALQDARPKVSENQVLAYLRMCMIDRMSYLVRSRNICSLDIIDKGGLDVAPIMYEKWCKATKNAQKEEFQEIYVHRLNYAKSLGVAEFCYGLESDAAMLHVTEVLPNSRKQAIYVKEIRA